MKKTDISNVFNLILFSGFWSLKKKLTVGWNIFVSFLFWNSAWIELELNMQYGVSQGSMLLSLLSCSNMQPKGFITHNLFFQILLFLFHHYADEIVFYMLSYIFLPKGFSFCKQFIFRLTNIFIVMQMRVLYILSLLDIRLELNLNFNFDTYYLKIH